MCGEEEPVTFNEAVIQAEYDAIVKNETWSLCDLPADKKVVSTKWVYKLKGKRDGSVDRPKARLVAKGYA